MPRWFSSIAVTLVLGAGAMAGEARTEIAPVQVKPGNGVPTIALRSTLVDAARSNRNPVNLDRIRFIAGVLLPLSGPHEVRVFDHEVRTTTDLAKEVFTERSSDYLKAFSVGIQPLVQNRAGVLVTLAGDGQIEVVSESTQAEYRSLAPANATREAINNAVAAELVKHNTAAVGAANLHWLLLSTEDFTAPARPPTSVMTWIVDRRKDAVLLSLPHLQLGRLLEALDGLGAHIPGERLGGGVADIVGPGAFNITVPEGTVSTRILLHAPAGDGHFQVRVLDARGKVLDDSSNLSNGPRLTTLDNLGVARAWRIEGCEAGARLTLEIAGASQPYELATLIDTTIRHRMEALPAEGTPGLFAGEPVRIRHTWLRAPGDTPISEALRNELEKTSRLQVAGVVTPDLHTVQLPAQAGSADCVLLVPAPWTPRVVSQPLRLAWTAPQPLTLAGGFTTTTTADDKTVQLEFLRAGGKRALSEAVIQIRGPGSAAPRAVTVRAVAGDPIRLTGSTVFSSSERGVWTINTASPVAGRNESGLIVARSGTSLTIEVTRDWLPIILGIIALLLLLIGLLVWWLMTRPRIRNEVLLGKDGQFSRLDGAPGLRRATSYGCAAFAKKITLRATRSGLILDAIEPGTIVWLNAREVQIGSLVIAGNDIELQSGVDRVHARLFASQEEATAWDIEKAQIDPHSFPTELVILES